MKRIIPILLFAFAFSACTQSDKPAEPAAPRETQPKRQSVLLQAKAAGVIFEFEADKEEYSSSEPITITVHAVNKSDADVVLRPRSTYPSLFDFGILDNGKHVPWTLNMALNFKQEQNVHIPAKSRIKWSEEDIVETTKTGGGASLFSARGKHVLSFGTGNTIEIRVK
jgi:hypothetical protein